jgi:hypothetical protein
MVSHLASKWDLNRNTPNLSMGDFAHGAPWGKRRGTLETSIKPDELRFLPMRVIPPGDTINNAPRKYVTIACWN